MARGISYQRPERLASMPGRHRIFVLYPWWRRWWNVFIWVNKGGKPAGAQRGEWRYIG